MPPAVMRPIFAAAGSNAALPSKSGTKARRSVAEWRASRSERESKRPHQAPGMAMARERGKAMARQISPSMAKISSTAAMIRWLATMAQTAEPKW